MDMPARPFDQPVTHQRRLMGRVVVHHQMHVEITWYRNLNFVQEPTELHRAMTGVALANYPAGGDVQRGEKRGRAMPFIIRAAPCRLSRTHRYHRLAAIHRLDLRLLIDTQ